MANNIIEARPLQLEQLAASWIQYIDATPKTIQTYTRAIKQLVIYFDYNGITQPDEADLIAYKRELSATCKPATINLYITALRKFFKWTAKQELYPDIAADIKNVKIARGFRKDYLSKEKAAELISSIDTTTIKGKRDYAIIALALTTGTRSIELQRANIEDLSYRNGQRFLWLQGKGEADKNSGVKIAPQVDKAIADYLTARGEAPASAPLFASASNHNHNGRLNTCSISKMVKGYLRAMGIDDERYTEHSLRHTAITLARLNGGSLEEVQQMARHKNITTTQLYDHSLSRDNNNTELNIADSLFSV